ncbi:MAG: nodulation protein NfeD [Thermomicrobiales bacterium]|nr:nodulation protein NfeD [Thermomicrobiales bacterium]
MHQSTTIAVNANPIPGGARLLVWLMLAFAALSVMPFAAFGQDAQPEVVVGQIDDTITPVMADYVERVIEKAEKEGAAAVVFEMDTPGGLSSAMDDIIRDILESEVPVVVYVSPRGARAASAGVYIAYAAHVSAMAPGTNIGSASPVFMGADGDTTDGDDTMSKKVTNDAVAQIVNLANLRDRNAEWAEEAVREAVNITADEALDLNVIDVMAGSLDDLLTEIDGMSVELASGPVVLRTAQASVDRESMNLLDRILQFLADPTIAYLFLSLGLLGIFFELSSPGSLIPGIVGVLGVLIGLFGLGTLPVNWTGVILILLAFGLFALDIFVPSLGLLTVGGLISFIVGSYMLIDKDVPGFEISRVAIWTMALCFAGFFALIGFLVVRSQLRKPATGKPAMVGEVGTVRSELHPDGMVFAFGEFWSATIDPSSEVESIPVGTPVMVTGIQSLKLFVRPATDEELAGSAAPSIGQIRDTASDVSPAGAASPQRA